VAQESNGMAKIFAAQGRYGAALGSMKDALNNIRLAKETTTLSAEIVGGWGDLLAQVGRAQEGRPSLDESLKIAQQIKDDSATARATNWLGDAYFYQGDNANARQQYDRAFQIASKTTDKEVALIARVNRDKTDLALGKGASVIADFKKSAQDADALGLKALSVECSVYLAQAEIASKNAKGVDQELSLTLAKAENLGLRLLEAKTQYLQGVVLSQGGKGSDAGLNFREAVRILDGISKEANSSDFLNRADLKSIYADAKKGATGQSIENPAE
jgi:eukaryotic-like serine/threonine-protein kinase